MHKKKRDEGERANELKKNIVLYGINIDTDTVLNVWRRRSEILSNIWWQIFLMIKISLGSIRQKWARERKEPELDRLLSLEKKKI